MRVIKIIVTVAMITAWLNSNAQNTKALEGRWRVDIEETILRTDKYHHNRIKNMPARAQEGLRKSFADREFNFDKNGKLILNLKIKDELKELTGSWQYNEEKKELVTTFDAKAKSFLVKWEGNDFIILDYKKAASDEGALKFLCLRRIN